MSLRRVCQVGAAIAVGALSLGASAAHQYSAPVAVSVAGWASTQPWDIGNDGSIVGQVADAGFVNSKGFIRQGATVTLLDGPAGSLSAVATGIADDGTVVGVYTTGDPAAPTEHGFLFKSGSYASFEVAGAAGAAGTEIRHISSNGLYLTGLTFDAAGGIDGFAYDRQTTHLKVYANALRVTIAQGTNAQGLVTGSITGPTGGGFVHNLNDDTLTVYTSIDGHLRPRFRDINDGGLITGFVAIDGIAMVGTPGDWFYFALPNGAVNNVGYGLNNAGDLVGFWSEADGTAHGWISHPIPEPATWALMLAGSLGVLLRRRAR